MKINWKEENCQYLKSIRLKTNNNSQKYFPEFEFQNENIENIPNLLDSIPKYMNYLRSDQPDRVDDAYQFFKAHPNIINNQLFTEILTIIPEKITGNFLSMLAVVLHGREEFCLGFFSLGFFSVLSNLLTEEHYLLIKDTLRVFRNIADTSKISIELLINNGIFDPLKGIHIFLIAKFPSLNWENEHIDLFANYIDLFISLLRYSPIDIELYLPLYNSIPSLIIEDLKPCLQILDRKKIFEFIRQLFVYLCFKTDEDNEQFNNFNVFSWMISNFAIDDSHLHQLICDALVAITGGPDILTYSIFKLDGLINILLSLDALNPKISIDILVILRNFICCDNPETIGFVKSDVCFQFLMNKLTDSDFQSRIEALRILLIIIDMSSISENESFINNNLNLLQLITDIIAGSVDEDVINVFLISMNKILMIGEKNSHGQPNIYVSIIVEAGIKESLERFILNPKLESNAILVNSLIKEAELFDSMND